MLRIYFLQQWYALADEALKDALYDSQAMRTWRTSHKRTSCYMVSKRKSSPTQAIKVYKRAKKS